MLNGHNLSADCVVIDWMFSFAVCALQVDLIGKRRDGYFIFKKKEKKHMMFCALAAVVLSVIFPISFQKESPPALKSVARCGSKR